MSIKYIGQLIVIIFIALFPVILIVWWGNFGIKWAWLIWLFSSAALTCYVAYFYDKEFTKIEESNGYYSFNSDEYHVTRDYNSKTFKLHAGSRGGFYPFNKCTDDTSSNSETITTDDVKYEKFDPDKYSYLDPSMDANTAAKQNRAQRRENNRNKSNKKFYSKYDKKHLNKY